MTDSPLKGEALMAYLKSYFGDVATISTKQFREFIGFSMSTDVRMRKLGLYPRVIRMPGGQKNARIFLQDVAAWIEQGGCQIIEQQKAYTGKRRDRPVGSKNKGKSLKNGSSLFGAEDRNQEEVNYDEIAPGL